MEKHVVRLMVFLHCVTNQPGYTKGLNYSQTPQIHAYSDGGTLLSPLLCALGALRDISKNSAYTHGIDTTNLVESSHRLISTANLQLVPVCFVIPALLIRTLYCCSVVSDTVSSTLEVAKLSVALPSVLSTLSQAPFPPRISSTSFFFMYLRS